MESKTTFTERIKTQLREWDARFDEMKKGASKATEARIVALREKRDVVRMRLSQLTSAAPDAWEDFKQGVENAWDELRSAFDEGDKPKKSH